MSSGQGSVLMCFGLKQTLVGTLLQPRLDLGALQFLPHSLAALLQLEAGGGKVKEGKGLFGFSCVPSSVGRTL